MKVALFSYAISLSLIPSIAQAEVVYPPSCTPTSDIDSAVEMARQAHANPKDKVDELFSDEPFDEAWARSQTIKANELCKKLHKEYEQNLKRQGIPNE